MKKLVLKKEHEIIVTNSLNKGGTIKERFVNQTSVHAVLGVCRGSEAAGGTPPLAPVKSVRHTFAYIELYVTISWFSRAIGK